ncbi:restriction endonuclease subunit S [Zunongwangia sp. SCSIO 43204]|uniref:restriction endonuclease subunit S n=1 Tax=Zunongwangia sp. SCSIO 43204 TaxID=2779359 RepID=UPI001CA9E64C|nr:restriction endonuclease subunit S [Zunongwangia sp. SCSIO 43204]UAB85090.1 restriction endonuclease subunit S [Zunongwangia sp. SCSIO 43204]
MDLQLKNKNWKEFDLKDIFPKIQRGKRLKKADHQKGKVPYVSSTASNNGIDGFIGNNEGVRIFSDCLSLANSGSVGSCFYQPSKFVASDHVTKLENPKFNKYVYLFLSSVVNRISEKYSFNREINDTRIKKEKILLPVNKDDKPDFEFMEKFMREKEAKLLEKYKNYISLNISNLKRGGVIPLSEVQWLEFEIENIFNINSGKRLTKADMKKGAKPFIGATDSNNGITQFVSNTNNSEDSNVLGVNYNGSVVENFYHPYKAIFSDDVKRLSFKKNEGNKHLFLFVKTQILKQKAKYQYGYKFNGTRMNKQKIMLPVNDQNEPDYDYMENYMKQLEYKKLNEYLRKKRT